MKRIENKLYELVTKPENFEFAHDIYDRYKSIEERLFFEFICAILDQCKEEFTGMKWVELENNPGEIKFFFHLPEWKKVDYYFYFDTSELYFGIRLNVSEVHKKIHKTIETHLETKIDDVLEISEDDDAWDRYYKFDNDFSTLSGLMKILPDNRPATISEIISKAKSIMEEIETELSELDKLVS